MQKAYAVLGGGVLWLLADSQSRMHEINDLNESARGRVHEVHGIKEHNEHERNAESVADMILFS